MMNREELLKLADRCEQADGPSYALECDIAKALNPNFTRMTVPKNYTTSIDAAMQLVPEGMIWLELRHFSDGDWGCNLCLLGMKVDGVKGVARTKELALCAGDLRAIADMKEG